MDHSQIKAFFFDLDGTLRIPKPSPIDAFIQVARTVGVTIPPSTVQRLKLWAYRFWGQDKRIKEKMDRLGFEQFWIYYSGLLLDVIDPKENTLERATYISSWFHTKYAPAVSLESSCLKTLSYLKGQGFTLGLISNRAEPLDTAVNDLGLDNIFDLTLAAGEVDAWKPNPVIFHHALSYFPQLSPEMCVYVGDNYFADSLGAEAAGLIPVTFDPELIYASIEGNKIQAIEQLIPLTIGELPRSW